MNEHKSWIELDKTGRTFVSCDGSADHLPHRVEITEGVNAGVRLQEKGRVLPDWAKGHLFDSFVLCVIIEHSEKMQDGIEKKNLRRFFPGMGGDQLTEILNRLLAQKAIAVGSVDAKLRSLTRNEG